MLQTMRNAWKTEDIRRKNSVYPFVILIYRLGNAVPVPYVNIDALGNYFDTMQNTIFGMLNVMSGGAFANATIFALSIQPYINASIIIQLLGIAFPKLGNLSKEGGEEGKKKIAAITRYTTVGIGLLQGFAYYMMIKGYGFLTTDGQSLWAAIVIILTFTSGSALIMWLGEQITEFGIGNGISIILFASIVSRFPTDVYNMISSAAKGTTPVWVTALMLLGALAMIVLIVIINDSERRLPVQYAKRVVGRKMYGGQSTHLPMKVNMSGRSPHHLRSDHRNHSCDHRRLHRTQRQRMGKHDLNPLCHRLLPADNLLRILLLDNSVRPHRGIQQPEEERRLHSGLPSRQADQRLYQKSAQQDHPLRCYLSEYHRCCPHSDCTLQPAGRTERRVSGRHLDHNRRRCCT